MSGDREPHRKRIQRCEKRLTVLEEEQANDEGEKDVVDFLYDRLNDLETLYGRLTERVERLDRLFLEIQDAMGGLPDKPTRDPEPEQNEYRPWESEGITEADYFKQRYIEARATIKRLEDQAIDLADERDQYRYSRGVIQDQLTQARKLLERVSERASMGLTVTNSLHHAISEVLQANEGEQNDRTQ
jgi:hypothetical protein